MKWFIKCLRHYADFSGRARRKEYWMFALFNGIFMIVLLILLAAMVANRWDEEILPGAFLLVWFSLLGLPGLAVAVRRLHDQGKSGWWMLLALIPLVGAIWLLVLMLTNGQTGENRFGPDPKTSPETFPERAKLTSAGVVMIIAASLGLFSCLSMRFFPFLYYGSTAGAWDIPFTYILRVLVFAAAMLAAGVWVVRSRERGEVRPAFWILLAVCGWSGITSLLQLPRMLGAMEHGVFSHLHNIVSMLLYLSVALMAALLLFAPRNRSAARGSATAVLVLGGLALAAWLLQIGMSDSVTFFLLVASFGTIGLMLLAWIFLSKSGEASSGAQTSAERPVAAPPRPAPTPAPAAAAPTAKKTGKGGISILDRYREGVMYLDGCESFDESQFREFNRVVF